MVPIDMDQTSSIPSYLCITITNVKSCRQSNDRMMSNSVGSGTDMQSFGDILCSTFYGEIAHFITGNDFLIRQFLIFRPTVFQFTAYHPENRAITKGNGRGMGEYEKDLSFQHCLH